jgi:hypothetical protein
MIRTQGQVIFSRQTWEALLESDIYREVIEMIEDIEMLNQTKNDNEEFIDLDDYHFKKYC